MMPKTVFTMNSFAFYDVTISSGDGSAIARHDLVAVTGQAFNSKNTNTLERPDLYTHDLIVIGAGAGGLTAPVDVHGWVFA